MFVVQKGGRKKEGQGKRRRGPFLVFFSITPSPFPLPLIFLLILLFLLLLLEMAENAQFLQVMEKFIKTAVSTSVNAAMSSVQPPQNENEKFRKLAKAVNRLRKVVLIQSSKVAKSSSKSPMHNKRAALRVSLKRKDNKKTKTEWPNFSPPVLYNPSSWFDAFAPT